MFSEEIYNNFVNDFAKVLREKIEDLEVSKLIFLCIGTDRIIGDSFGPLVGYKLEKLFKDEENIEVIGTLNNNVSMQNIFKILNKIECKNDNYFKVVIDAALSNKNKIGRIIVSKNKMNVGSSIYKQNIFIGDMSIKGIVARNQNNSRYNYMLLKNNSLRINNGYGKYSSKWNL